MLRNFFEKKDGNTQKGQKRFERMTLLLESVLA